jgi:hypothetical protein
MVSIIPTTEMADAGACCGNCHHSVDVRGMDQIVCLAHLAVFESAKASHCGEFEHKRAARLKGG